jgi:hypothetical protein
MSKLFVVYPTDKLIERWDLAKLEKEKNFNIDYREKVTSVGMGCGVESPLILAGPRTQTDINKTSLVFLETQNLKEVHVAQANGTFNVTFSAAAELRVSANGELITAVFTKLVGNLQTYRLVKNTIQGVSYDAKVEWAYPNGAGNGVYASNGRLTGDRFDGSSATYGAVNGPLYLTISDRNPATGAAVLTVTGPSGPYARYPDVPGYDGVKRPFEKVSDDLAKDRRIVLIEEAKLLVVVPPTADKLHLFRLEAGRGLGK